MGNLTIERYEELKSAERGLLKKLDKSLNKLDKKINILEKGSDYLEITRGNIFNNSVAIVTKDEAYKTLYKLIKQKEDNFQKIKNKSLFQLIKWYFKK